MTSAQWIMGRFQVTQAGGETVRAFIPHPLPPSRPALALDGESAARHAEAIAAMARFEVAGTMVPDADWFLYGFARKEAVISSHIEGTQATLQDVLTFEATKQSERPEDAQEVCNYIDALTYARGEMAKPEGFTPDHAVAPGSSSTPDAWSAGSRQIAR